MSKLLEDAMLEPDRQIASAGSSWLPAAEGCVVASIHDATAKSFDDVHFIAETLRRNHCQSADILVVCGSEWSSLQLDNLRRLEDSGFCLQGHGWTHRA